MMMKRIAVLFLIVGSTALAQSIAPLISGSSLKTYLSLPFQLKDGAGSKLDIFNVSLTAGDSSCQVMVDPYIKSNFFVKCSQPSAVKVGVYFYDQGEYKKINYGPVQITALSNLVVGTPSTPGSTYAVGKQLFINNCLECHSAGDKANRSVTGIKSALTNQPSMRSIVLTNEQIQSISDYLGHL